MTAKIRTQPLELCSGFHVGGLKPRCGGGTSRLWWETILMVLIVQDHGRSLVRRFSFPNVYIIISMKHLLTIGRDSDAHYASQAKWSGLENGKERYHTK